MAAQRHIHVGFIASGTAAAETPSPACRQQFDRTDSVYMLCERLTF